MYVKYHIKNTHKVPIKANDLVLPVSVTVPCTQCPGPCTLHSLVQGCSSRGCTAVYTGRYKQD